MFHAWFIGGCCESALQFCECVPFLQIAKQIVVQQWFGLRSVGSKLVRGWFADGSRVVLASLPCNCASACVCCKPRRKSWFTSGFGLVQVGSGFVRWCLAVGSCESALQFCECLRFSQFAKKTVVHPLVHCWFRLGSLLVHWWFAGGSFARGRRFR